MNREQIRNLLSDLIQEIDYDIWKEYFVYARDEDEEDDEDFVDELGEELDRLVDIVERHLEDAE